MISYALLAAAVTMFSFQFLFNGIFEKEYGNGIKAMLVFSSGSSAVGFIILLAINKFQFEFTPFTLIMAILAALDSVGYTYFSLKSLGRINLSMYSMFAMLGGMVLPSIAGICFFGEKLTVGKAVCFALILVSLLLTIKNLRIKKNTLKVNILNQIQQLINKNFVSSPIGFARQNYIGILNGWMNINLSFTRCIIINFINRRT